MIDYILTLDHEVNDCRYCPCVRFICPTDSEVGDCVCFAYKDDLNGSNIIANNVTEVDMVDSLKSKKIEKPSWCPMKMTENKVFGKWYDGIPTEEGRYLLYCSNGTEDFHYNKLERKGDKLEWRYNWIGEIIAYMPIVER